MATKTNINLDATTLRLFLQVAQRHSISRAAEALSMVPAAASRRIKLFEAHFGQRLVQRRPHGVVLTDAGTRAVPHVRRILDDIDTLFQDIGSPQTPVKHAIRIASSSSVIPQFLANDLSARSHALAGIDIEVIERHSKDVLDMVRNGAADLGIYESSHRDTDLYFVPYRCDELILLAHPLHPLASLDAVPMAQLLAETLVYMEDDTAIFKGLRKQADKAGMSLRIRFRVRNFTSMVAMIKAHHSAGVLPRAVADTIDTDHSLKRVRIDERWSVRMFEICCFPERAGDADIRTIMDVLGIA